MDPTGLLGMFLGGEVGKSMDENQRTSQNRNS